MDITIHSQTCLRPKQAIFIYGETYTNVAATLHTIKGDELSAGKHLDMNSLEDIFRSSNGPKTMEFLPENVLSLKNQNIIWYEKSRKHPIFFETTEKRREELNKLSGRKVYWPPLLFMIKENALFCWSLSSNKRPTPKTKLYIAPLTHINESAGNVCLPSGFSLSDGNTPMEKMRLVSDNFYKGVFGHGTGSMKQINHPKGHDGFWIEYLKTKKRRFPHELLIEAGKTLEDLLK